VLGRIRALVPSVELLPVPKKHPGETSERWAWADGSGAVGFINSVSRPFCGDCSRVRLGADGRLYTCLFSAAGFDLRAPLRAGENAGALSLRLEKLWTGRSDRYSELRTDGGGKKVEMFAVGG
jgi:GTP 3',8-cyclase